MPQTIGPSSAPSGARLPRSRPTVVTARKSQYWLRTSAQPDERHASDPSDTTRNSVAEADVAPSTAARATYVYSAASAATIRSIFGMPSAVPDQLL